MRIRETGCDDTIKLSKFKFNCDEVDKLCYNAKLWNAAKTNLTKL